MFPATTSRSGGQLENMSIIHDHMLGSSSIMIRPQLYAYFAPYCFLEDYRIDRKPESCSIMIMPSLILDSLNNPILGRKAEMPRYPRVQNLRLNIYPAGVWAHRCLKNLHAIYVTFLEYSKTFYSPGYIIGCQKSNVKSQKSGVRSEAKFAQRPSRSHALDHD